jgi:hypothetical protein
MLLSSAMIARPDTSTRKPCSRALLTPLNSATILKSVNAEAELSQPLLDQGRLTPIAGGATGIS